MLWGPPFNRSLEEIGWMTRRKITKLALSYRDREGILDLDTAKAFEQQEKEAGKAQEALDADPYAIYRSVRRFQAIPEYLIEKEIRQQKALAQSAERQPKLKGVPKDV